MYIQGVNNNSFNKTSFKGRLDKSIYKYLRSTKTNILVRSFDIFNYTSIKNEEMQTAKRLIPYIQTKLEKYADEFSPEIKVGLYYEPAIHFLKFKNTKTGFDWHLSAGGFDKNAEGLKEFQKFVDEELIKPKFLPKNIEAEMNEYYLNLQKDKQHWKEQKKAEFTEFKKVFKELFNLKIASK